MPHPDQSSHPCERRKGGAAHQIEARDFLTARMRGCPHPFPRNLRKGGRGITGWASPPWSTSLQNWTRHEERHFKTVSSHRSKPPTNGTSQNHTKTRFQRNRASAEMSNFGSNGRAFSSKMLFVLAGSTFCLPKRESFFSSLLRTISFQTRSDYRPVSACFYR
jgi:hypothetical protein